MARCEWFYECEYEAVGYIGYDDHSMTFACEDCFADHAKNTTLVGGVHFGYSRFDALERFEKEYLASELEVS
jgi:Zn-finger protein